MRLCDDEGVGDQVIEDQGLPPRAAKEAVDHVNNFVIDVASTRPLPAGGLWSHCVGKTLHLKSEDGKRLRCGRAGLDQTYMQLMVSKRDRGWHL